jgi:hypothetical protein
MSESLRTQNAIWNPYSVIAVRRFFCALPLNVPRP